MGMVFTVIEGGQQAHPSGFTTSQFRRLDGLFLRSVSQKILSHRTVDCDFDEKYACYTYFKSEAETPYLQFFIKQVGPRTMMYEIYIQTKGRIFKSGVFDKAFDRLTEEVEKIKL